MTTVVLVILGLMVLLVTVGTVLDYRNKKMTEFVADIILLVFLLITGYTAVITTATYEELTKIEYVIDR